MISMRAAPTPDHDNGKRNSAFPPDTVTTTTDGPERPWGDGKATAVAALGSLNLYNINGVGAGMGDRGWSWFSGMVSQRRA